MAPANVDICFCGHAWPAHDSVSQLCRFKSAAPSCGCNGFGAPGTLGDVVADGVPLSPADGDL